MPFLLTLVIFWWKILRLLPYNLFPLLSVVRISASGHYIFRFILSPLASTPHHIDRFGATCSLHSQEDGKDSSCQILSFILRCLQQCPLQRDGRRKPSLGSASRFCAWTERSLHDLLSGAGWRDTANVPKRPVVLGGAAESPQPLPISRS